jgi:galactokinase
VQRDRARAFAPGRVNLIGEHTDYNGGLALPFAIDLGVTVTAERVAAAPEHDSPFVRGALTELGLAGEVEVEIESDLPQGAGLGSSAALTVALCMALGALTGAPEPGFVALAQLAQRIENEHAGARTGLLDQLASLCARPGEATLIDFATLARERVPLALGDWRFAVLHSGERHSNAAGGYAERFGECRRAAALAAGGSPLPAPLARRARHVETESARVRATVAALCRGDLSEVGAILNASHASLRDDFEVSTSAVECARERLLRAGAAGARVMGGGFGGSVLALFGPGTALPAGAVAVQPAAGARRL